MHRLAHLAIAASVAITAYAVPSTSFAMECRELCFGFYPQHSLLQESSASDECQRRINDSGGACTIHGKRNLGMDMPRGVNYRREDYVDPRKYDWDVYGIPWW
jgi:hypothetical protein